MTVSTTLDGVIVQWGERLFYPPNRLTRTRTPTLTGLALHQRAQALRQRIEATVVRRAAQVVVKVTGGGRGMGAIAAHLRYIAKGGRLSFEDDRGVTRDGDQALRAVVDQWRLGGSRIPEVSSRREAFNVMLSMPAGIRPEYVLQAARVFAKTELVNHRYVMVLHTHQASPHVHLTVRAEGRDGRRLNPRKDDLRRWRETFADKLRELGIEAEASPQSTRVTRHRNERVWERKTAQPRVRRKAVAEPLPSGARKHALQAWVEITRALAVSPDASDRRLAKSIYDYLERLPDVRAIVRERERQRELPGMSRSAVVPPQRRGPEIER